jgi:hypothetical protein
MTSQDRYGAAVHKVGHVVVAYTLEGDGTRSSLKSCRNNRTHSRRLPPHLPGLISVAGRLQPSQKNVSPYCDEMALKPSDIASITMPAPACSGWERLASPVSPQLGHLKTSVQCSKAAMMTSIRARAAKDCKTFRLTRIWFFTGKQRPIANRQTCLAPVACVNQPRPMLTLMSGIGQTNG